MLGLLERLLTLNRPASTSAPAHIPRARSDAADGATRVLVISARYPPYATVGAIRVSKLTKYLDRAGANVQVLTLDRDPDVKQGLDVEIEAHRVHRARYRDLNAPVRRIMGGESRVQEHGYAVSTRRRSVKVLAATVRDLYRVFVHWPDAKGGWIRPAVRHASRRFDHSPPQVVYASSPPFSTAVIAAKLAKRWDAKLVVEFRDPWATFPSNGLYSTIRRWADLRIEARVLRHAAGLVTVTEPWKQQLQTVYGKPVAIIPNGFDPALLEVSTSGREQKSQTDRFELVYTGNILSGHPIERVLEAIAELPESSRRRIRVVIAGRSLGPTRAVAEALGIEDVIDFRGPLPHAQTVRLQQDADALLLLDRDLQDWGGIPAKSFEYFASGHPILCVARPESHLAHWVDFDPATRVAWTDDEIRTALRAMMAFEVPHREVAVDVPPLREFNRQHQASDLLAWIDELPAGATPT